MMKAERTTHTLETTSPSKDTTLRYLVQILARQAAFEFLKNQSEQT